MRLVQKNLKKYVAEEQDFSFPVTVEGCNTLPVFIYIRFSLKMDQYRNCEKRIEKGFQGLLSIFAEDQIAQGVQSLTRNDGNEELKKMAEVAAGATAIVSLT